MARSLAAVQILLLRFVIQRKLIFLLQVVKAKEKFFREFMRLRVDPATLFSSGGGSRPDSFESFYGDESIVVTFIRE